MSERRARSPKVAAIRDAFAAANPESGGNPQLSTVDQLKLQLVAAGDEGALLADLRRSLEQSHLGKERRDVALAALRADPAVIETRERRPDRSGRLREQVALRLSTLAAG